MRFCASSPNTFTAVRVPEDCMCCLWHGISFEEPNPTGSRARDLM